MVPAQSKILQTYKCEAVWLWVCSNHRGERLPQVRGWHPSLPRPRSSKEQGLQPVTGHVVHRGHHLRLIVRCVPFQRKRRYPRANTERILHVPPALLEQHLIPGRGPHQQPPPGQNEEEIFRGEIALASLASGLWDLERPSGHWRPVGQTLAHSWVRRRQVANGKCEGEAFVWCDRESWWPCPLNHSSKMTGGCYVTKARVHRRHVLPTDFLALSAALYYRFMYSL